MANMRYRKPSVKTILGVTKLKKRVKKALGINTVLAPFRAVNNYQRRMLRRAGYYSPEMKALRAAKKGQVAGPIGAIQVSEGEKGAGKGVDGGALLMAAMLSQGDHDKKGEGVNPLLMGAMLAGDALGGEGKGHKKGDDGPGLAEAMLLATAMKGSGEEHESKAKHAPRAKHAAKEDDEPEEEQPHKARSSPSKAKKDEEPEPKRKKGFRLFG